MDVSFTNRVVMPDDVLERGIGNESILLNLNNENYYGLDEMGRHFWVTLEASASIQDAYDKLLAKYDVDEGTLRTDLIEFIGVLAEQGLIELRAPEME